MECSEREVREKKYETDLVVTLPLLAPGHKC